MKPKYFVETYYGEWVKVPFTESDIKAYCDGYVDAMDSLYPSRPYRIVKDGKVIRETKGRARVK